VTHYVVFDLETVPDLAVARRLLGLDAAAPDDAVRKAIGQRYARPDQEPNEVFLKAALSATCRRTTSAKVLS
jgi:predicted PolB exonuclease-like 3'-5' exonuclease